MNKLSVVASLALAAVVIGLPLGFLVAAIVERCRNWLRLKRARTAMSDLLVESKVRVELDSERGVGLPLDGTPALPRDGRRQLPPGGDRRVKNRRAGAVGILLLWFVATAAVAVAYTLWTNGYHLD